jgi:hypothetical protein
MSYAKICQVASRRCSPHFSTQISSLLFSSSSSSSSFLREVGGGEKKRGERERERENVCEKDSEGMACFFPWFPDRDLIGPLRARVIEA